MRILTSSGEFNLPADFEAELSRNNVMLTDAGEQTAPITFPPTPENLRLVNWSNRLDNYYKPLTDLDVLVIDGLMHRRANLSIHTADEEEGISCTLYFASGEFYSRIGNTRLNWLSWPVWKHPNWNASIIQVPYLIDLLKAEYNNPTPEAIFCIVPVMTTQKFTWVTTGGNIPGTFILNGLEKFQYIADLSTPVVLDKFEGEYLQRIVQDGTTIHLGLGYGMTPFLKVRYMIEFVFEKFGYTVDMNEVTAVTGAYANNICYINNVADAIYGGVLNFKQLVPDVTIKEFILEVEKDFAGKFVMNEVSKVAKFCRYENVLKINAVPDIDMTPYLTGIVKQGGIDFTTIKLKDKEDTTKDTTEVAPTELSFDFVKETSSLYLYIANGEQPPTQINLSMITTAEIVHLNSHEVVAGVAATEKEPATSSLIRFMNVHAGWYTITVLVGTSEQTTVSFRRSSYLFNDLIMQASSSMLVMEMWYDGYKKFRKNSNIPLTAEMNIPAPVLEQMKLHTPKLLNGQPVMIESIKYALGKKGMQTVTLRTLRPYADRMNAKDVLLPPTYIYAATVNEYRNVLKEKIVQYIYAASYSNYKDKLINI